jgi:uncharacterized phage-associated protein
MDNLIDTPTALSVARYIIRRSNISGEPITNLKLQKLLYYAQGWSLAFFSKRLFAEDFEAWIRGPVVPSIYRHYKVYKHLPIAGMPNRITFSKKIEDFLNEVLLTYLKYDAFTLERMTHNEKPWQEARGSLSPDAPCKRIINEKTMKDFFKAQLNG